MLRMILKDYRMTSKEGVARLFRNGGFYFYFYLLMYPVIVGAKFGVKEDCIYYAGSLFFVFTILLSRMYPNRLEKTMYYCPLSANERTAYVKTSYWFRVVLPLILFAIAEGILAAAGWIKLWTIPFLMLVLVCNGLTMNTYIVRGNQKKGIMEWYPAWNVLIQIFGMINMVIWVLLQMEEDVPERWEMIFVLALLSGYAALSTRMLQKYRKPIWEMAVDYEAM